MKMAEMCTIFILVTWDAEILVVKHLPVFNDTPYIFFENLLLIEYFVQSV